MQTSASCLRWHHPERPNFHPRNETMNRENFDDLLGADLLAAWVKAEKYADERIAETEQNSQPVNRGQGNVIAKLVAIRRG